MSFWAILYPLKNPKNQNFVKIKIKPEDIIISHLCTTDNDPMIYGSWDMEDDT